MRAVTQGRIANDETIPVIFLGGWSGMCSEAALVPVGFLATARNYELEADALAV
jgi:hypothetical protein